MASVTITWDAPPEDYFLVEARYRQVSPDIFWIGIPIAPDTTSATVIGLMDGVDYEFQLRHRSTPTDRVSDWVSVVASPSMEVRGSFGGAPAGGMIVARRIFARAVDFGAGHAGSRARAAVAPASAATFVIRREGAEIGTMTFGAGATTAAFAGAGAAFAAGELLTITGPDPADDDISGIAWALLGRPAAAGPSDTEIAGSQSGLTVADMEIFRWVAPADVTLPAGFAGSAARAAAASTGTATYDLLRNGSSIGSMIFDASATAAFSGAGAAVAAGDVLTIVAPSSPDATLADLAWSLLAYIDDPPLPTVFAGAFSGRVLGDVVVGRAVSALPVTIPAGMAGSVASAATAGASETIFILHRNGAAIGTMTFAAAATEATFAAAADAAFAAGDVLTIVAPSSPDATLRDIAWSIEVGRSAVSAVADDDMVEAAMLAADPASGPGAGKWRLYAVPEAGGTMALRMQAGTSATPVEIAVGVGGGA